MAQHEDNTMSGGAKKAAARDKNVQFANTRYEVLKLSFINGALQEPGKFVYLPVGVKAGSNLRPVGAVEDGDDDAPQSNVEAFLSRNAPDVIADLTDASDDGLAEALNSEKGGKGRVTVIEAIEREIEARKAK